MLIALAIVAVLAVAVIGLFIVVRRNLPRMHHYQFAHVALPTQVFASPDAVILPLLSPDRATPGGREALLPLWEEVGQATAAEFVPAEGLEYSIEILGHPNSTAIFIRLPQPLKKPEAYFAAIVFDGPGLALGQPRQLRYFVLEYHGEVNGSPKTLLGEWSPKANGALQYAEHGSTTPPELAAFTSRVRQIIDVDGKTPRPPD